MKTATMKTNKAKSNPPCDCGNLIAGWHGPRNGHRFYCCEKCYLETDLGRLEYQGLLKLEEAWKQFKKFYFNDLAANNPGFLGKLFINDFGAMNGAYIATARAENNLNAIRGET